MLRSSLNSQNTNSSIGPLLVGLAALLWGSDSIFRYAIADQIDPVFIVFSEHLLGVLVLLPWILLRHRKVLFQLSRKEWFSAIFVGIWGSAIATTIFTLSFKYVNPSVAVLLQKLQPVLVVIIAYLVLGETPSRRFFFWAVVAFAAGLVLSFPDLSFNLGVAHFKGVAFALGASLIWGASTVAGKVLVANQSAGVATFWRYVFGLITLFIVLMFSRQQHTLSMLVVNSQTTTAIIYVGLISGIIPMVLYYSGLARTKASVATFVELIYPISSVFLNYWVLGSELSSVQIVAGAVLIGAVTMISR